MPLGILIEVAGRKLQKDFEPILERQVHRFVNGAMGVMHIGQRDMPWIRVSQEAFDAGFRLRDFGVILHAKYLEEYPALVDKVAVTIYLRGRPALKPDPRRGARGLGRARRPGGRHDRRDGRDLLLLHALPVLRARTTSASSRPSGSACAAPTTGWTARSATRSTRPGPTSRSRRARCLDPVLGKYEGINQFVYQHVQQDRRAGQPLLDDRVADDLVRLLRVHHGDRARGERRDRRRPRVQRA